MIPTAPTCTCNTGSLLAVLPQIKFLDSWIQYIYLFFFTRGAKSRSSYPKILHACCTVIKKTARVEFHFEGFFLSFV
ncbi:hypothetical protein SORBI_3007G134220 [Sorghum bicolor]|uniref:Uncharacterized protein n=1 Tax=Sorghum bicolor TaxID=4558 RepID=A0A1Z5R9P9_SORBI|nr:hypothetical protein SORBI_3007G134220 [Sorghum bicolor]